MNIAVLSGKGGTGKTTISTNLAKLIKANYIDCDVEEPNGFIFLKPTDIKSRQVKVEYPVIDDKLCILCGECAKACQFNALIRTKVDVMVFEKLCHSCRACSIVCKPEAIQFDKRSIGVIEEGYIDGITCKRGILNVGEPMAGPIIRQLMKSLPEGLNIIDCSPGTSCNVVKAVQDADGAILVTEPSAFGFHDLKMAVELVRIFKLPFGVIVNKATDDEFFKDYFKKENINVLGYIPYKREAAEMYSVGKMLIDAPIYREKFEQVAQNIKEVLPWS